MNKLNSTYRSNRKISLRSLLNNKSTKWATRILLFFLFVAVFGDFIANDKPLISKRNNAIEIPVLKQYFVNIGWAGFDTEVFSKGWENLEYDWSIWPLVPYSANQLDLKNARFVSPFAKQDVPDLKHRHWLGTDQLGRDVLAGLVKGTRTALLVGLIAMSVAGLIGILIGGIAGYFGDHSIQLYPGQIVFGIFGIIIAVFLVYTAEWPALLRIITQAFLLCLPIFLLLKLASLTNPFFKGRKPIPVDLIVMRIIEVITSIPGMLLLLAILALVDKPTIFTVMLIIGFMSWPMIARFMRGELLRVRSQEFIQSAEVMGFSNTRVLWKHAIPNAIGPVIVTLAFGMAAAILIESALAFLGIGTGGDHISWGTLLNSARQNISAWWIAVLPGFMIFLMVSSLNYVGEALSKRIGRS